MFAIVEALGRQYRVSAGDLIKVDHIPSGEKSGLENSVKPGTKLAFTKVLAVGSDSGSLQVGTPFLKNVSINSGGSCKSPSIKTTASPVETFIPLRKADCEPKFRR